MEKNKKAKKKEAMAMSGAISMYMEEERDRLIMDFSCRTSWYESI